MKVKIFLPMIFPLLFLGTGCGGGGDKQVLIPNTGATTDEISTPIMPAAGGPATGSEGQNAGNQDDDQNAANQNNDTDGSQTGNNAALGSSSNWDQMKWDQDKWGN